MYIQNIRNSIAKFNDEEYKLFLKKLRNILRFQYGKESIKPSELKKRVDEFVHGKEPNSDYLEAYLLTFDDINENGAINALLNGKVESPQNLRELLAYVTENHTFSTRLSKHMEDEKNLLELRKLFFGCLRHCYSYDKEQFFKNLYSFNHFLEIKE
ncbi:hypothetical protein NYE33_33495 [Paenibacillus sp. FSL R10-2199]|uniref:hypothetical protein n=1 Tax=Paenibacillus sp. FSL R10-2199 TaxID=2975348 RepID=UPI0030F80DB7